MGNKAMLYGGELLRLVDNGDATHNLAVRWGGYSERVKAVSGLIAYYPLDEATGVVAYDRSGNGRNGTWNAQITLGAAGVGDGKTSVLCDADRLNLATSGVPAVFNGDEGTFAVWAKVLNAGIYSDTTADYLFQVTAGTSQIYLRKPTTANRLQAVRSTNATDNVIDATAFRQTGWIHVAITWSDAADAFCLYINGIHIGSSPKTGLAAWNGGVPTVMLIGAATTGPSTPWNGWLAHGLICNRALSQAEVRALSAPLDDRAFLPPTAKVLTTGYSKAMALGAVLYACHGTFAAKSVDFGDTWANLGAEFPGELHSVFPASNGYLYAAGDSKVYRSTDAGATWTEVFDSTVGYVSNWGWAENSEGDLFAGLYTNTASNVIYVYRSVDDGANWTRLEGLVALANEHTHQTFVDPETDRLYVSIGDVPKAAYYSDDKGATWTALFAARGDSGFTGWTSNATTRFMADDRIPGNNQIISSADDAAVTIALMPDWEYNDSINEVLAVHGTDTLFHICSNEDQNAGQKASILRSDDAGATWYVAASAPSGGYKFGHAAGDYRHRIPAELGYIICDCIQDVQMIRIPI